MFRRTEISTWVFDLDNTLYPPSARLFDQIEERMTDYVVRVAGVARDQASQLRQQYWETYGTTLAGLIRHHNIDPDPYLDAVHDIDFSPLSADPDLADHIAALPGRCIVYTNGAATYAKNVLRARGLSNVFDAIYGVEHANYRSKPDQQAFATVFKAEGLSPQSAVMFEDDPRNLLVPHELGMRTVLVGPTQQKAEHIHHHTTDLSAFLAKLPQ